ncbi:DgaE family pyridoxal phosphate-dependent ammonia lyase [Spiroplasma sp. DGKH1]|uniref:DgaE family pyridoxal phosphate-dependent ammonia lyase n=1 Tax=Spiroplasma sp. DGKH1 TaxID=3050074 RepID=UPI0034C6A554
MEKINSFYQKLNLKKVINAAGKMSIIGVSTISKAVGQSMITAGQDYVVMKDLVTQASRYLAKLLQVEDVHIVNCAAGGIAISVAGMIAQDNYALQLNVLQNHELPNEIILPKGHNINFGGAIETMVNLGGGVVKEAGYANMCYSQHLTSLINSRSAAVLYIKSHHCVQKSIISPQEAITTAHQHNLPIIIDCAAEEDLIKYYHQGADVVIYSGTKALSGPTAGLIIGKQKYLNYIRAQSGGIARAMKIGKENIAGLVQAVEEYLVRKPDVSDQIKLLEQLQVMIDNLPGIKSIIEQDEAGRELYRLKIIIDPAITNFQANDLIHYFENNDPILITRNNYANKNIIYIDPRALALEDIKIIGGLIQEYVKKEGQ